MNIDIIKAEFDNAKKNRTALLKNDIIYNKFKEFLEKYAEYFLDNIEIWKIVHAKNSPV